MSLSSGNITVSSGYKATYASTGTATLVAAAQDIFTITGSATKTIRILKIAFGGRQTTESLVEVLLLKRSTADTGGTPVSAKANYKSSNPAATATIVQQPTGFGSLVGIIRSTKINIPILTNPVGPKLTEYVWAFNRPGQELVLRGTSEVVAINLNNANILGGSISMWVEWTEE